jgi:glycosyltransferase involved in cell wall biosynthesis
MKYLIIGPLSSSKYSTQNLGGVATVMSAFVESFEKKVNFDLIATGKTNNTRYNNSQKKNFSFYLYLKLFVISLKYILWLEFKSFLLFNYYSFIFNKTSFVNYKLIHVHGLQGRIIDVISNLTSRPIVLTVHSYHEFMNKPKFKLNFWNKTLNQTLNKVEEIIHVSETDKLKGIELGFNIPALSKIVYNPIHIDELSINKINRDFNRIIFTGSLNKRKQIKVLIDSLNYLPKAIKLTICGDGELKHEIDILNKKLERIDYKGFIKNEFLIKQYNLHSVLVVPSLSESFGLVYLEAINSGLSVIGYHKVIEEFHNILNLDDEQKNILVPYKGSNPETLSKLISQTLKFRESKLAEPIIEEIKIRIKKQFSIEKITNEYIEIYKSVK